MDQDRTPIDRPDLEADQHESSVDEVEEYLERRFGTPTLVFHGIASRLVHIDVHAVAPTPEHDWWTLFTTGMSDRPMATPEGHDELRFAELVMKLPSTWQLEGIRILPAAPADHAQAWPIEGLRMLARLPHDRETWLGTGHTIPNADPPQPFDPSSELCAWLLLPPLGDQEQRTFSLADGSVINLYVVYAIYQDELDLKIKEGTGALLARFDNADLSDVLDPSRPSTIPQI